MTRCLLAGVFLSVSGGAVAEAQTLRVDLDRYVRLAATEVSIGKEASAGPDLFGEVRDVATDGEGRVYVLDTGDHSVRMFDGEGHFIARTGRPGRGPGDFAYPLSMVHDGDSSLFVVDQLNGISLFFTDASGLRFQRSFAASLFPRATCISDKQLFVAGYQDARLIHVLDGDGEVTRSFGDGFNSDTVERVRERANREPVLISCDASRKRLVVAQGAEGGVRGYSLDGRLLWSTMLPNYLGTRYRPTSDGVSIFWGPDYTESLEFVSERFLLVQVQRIKRLPANGRVNFERTSLVSYLVDVVNGEIVGQSSRLPVLKSVRADRALELRSEPFPMVRMVKIALGVQ